MKSNQEIHIVSAVDELRFEMPGTYAMDVAVQILELLERQAGAAVKNTGWKQGFGLEVGVGVPIRLNNVEAELKTDGSEITLRRISGSRGEFGELCDTIRRHDWRLE